MDWLDLFIGLVVDCVCSPPQEDGLYPQYDYSVAKTKQWHIPIAAPSTVQEVKIAYYVDILSLKKLFVQEATYHAHWTTAQKDVAIYVAATVTLLLHYGVEITKGST